MNEDEQTTNEVLSLVESMIDENPSLRSILGPGRNVLGQITTLFPGRIAPIFPSSVNYSRSIDWNAIRARGEQIRQAQQEGQQRLIDSRVDETFEAMAARLSGATVLPNENGDIVIIDEVSTMVPFDTNVLVPYARRDTEFTSRLQEALDRMAGNGQQRWQEIAQTEIGRSIMNATNDSVCVALNVAQELGIEKIYVELCEATTQTVHSRSFLKDMVLYPPAEEGEEMRVRQMGRHYSSILFRINEYRLLGEVSLGPTPGILGRWLWNTVEDTVEPLLMDPDWVPRLFATRSVSVRETKIQFTSQEITNHFATVYESHMMGTDDVMCVETLDPHILRIVHQDTFSPFKVIDLQMERVSPFMFEEPNEWMKFKDQWLARQSLIRETERTTWIPPSRSTSRP